ncbi:hypothetical protein BKA63DRAFT_78345 [Paraphoma chrysanthemicola]|nr:hypothetical protein BKA63DRAFT_78345 [Paraphoma chrysanthemicola]
MPRCSAFATQLLLRIPLAVTVSATCKACLSRRCRIRQRSWNRSTTRLYSMSQSTGATCNASIAERSIDGYGLGKQCRTEAEPSTPLWNDQAGDAHGRQLQAFVTPSAFLTPSCARYRRLHHRTTFCCSPAT